MVFLDSSPVIYFVERPPRWGAKAAARIAALRGAGAQLVVSDLVRMETAIGPLKANDPVRLADFATFFAASHVTVLPIMATVCDRAARIRAQYGFKPLDSLHLAAAVEHGCTHFLSNDAKLKRFPDILVEVLS
jgi:uncharacterized protein